MLLTVSRILAYIFAGYIMIVFTSNFLFGKNQSITIFIFMVFFNFGTQCACYQVLKLCVYWQEKVMFSIQLILYIWTLYAYRFLYSFVDMKADLSTLFFTPLTQYGIIVVCILALIAMNAESKP